MNRLPVSHPTLDFLLVYLQGRLDRARREDLSRGASAVEWVVISAIVVGIVAFVGVLINNAIKDKATGVGNCIAGTTNTNAGC